MIALVAVLALAVSILGAMVSVLAFAKARRTQKNLETIAWLNARTARKVDTVTDLTTRTTKAQNDAIRDQAKLAVRRAAESAPPPWPKRWGGLGGGEA